MAQKPKLQCPKGGIEISQEKNTVYTQLNRPALVPLVLSPQSAAVVVSAISIGGTTTATFVPSIYQIQI